MLKNFEFPGEVLIHVGAPKAGSSAIQKFLKENVDWLKRNGFFYPNHAVDPNGISSGNLLEVYDRLEDESLVLNRKKIKNLLEEFYGSGCGVLLLSSEFFFHRIVELSRVISNAKFVVYVRSPIEVAESGYNQQVKRHGIIGRIELPLNLPTNGVDLLVRTVNAIGPDRIVVRPYSPLLFRGGNILSDFISVVGLSKSLTVEPFVNSSYCYQALEVKRWANGFNLPPLIDRELDRLLQRYSSGDQYYTLIDRELFLRYQKQSVFALQRLADVIAGELISKLIEITQGMVQKPLKNQRLEYSEALPCVRYLFSSNLGLYCKLRLHLSDKGDIGKAFFDVPSLSLQYRLRYTLYSFVLNCMNKLKG